MPKFRLGGRAGRGGPMRDMQPRGRFPLESRDLKGYDLIVRSEEQYRRHFGRKPRFRGQLRREVYRHVYGRPSRPPTYSRPAIYSRPAGKRRGRRRR